MTFDFVLYNTDPLTFPDSVGLTDNLVYDPETGRLYDPQVDTNENDYEYRWGQNRWVSHVDLSLRKVLDDNFVNIPGDVMTGGLQMGLDILDSNHPMFIVKRYNLESLPWLTYDEMTVYSNHTLRCKEYVLGQRVTVAKNATVFNIKEPSYETKWYSLKLDPPYLDSVEGFDTIDGILTPIVNRYPFPKVPEESDWANMKYIGTGTNIILTDNPNISGLQNDTIEGDSYIRSIQTITETSPEVPVKPPAVESICDTPFITHQTTIPVVTP